jgi:hypothetical protein
MAWPLWLRCLPIVGDRLIADGRRQMCLTNEAPGLIPVACPRTIDNLGIELITRDGQMPVYLDSGQVFWGSG